MAVDTDNLTAWVNLALLHQSKQRINDAIQCYKKAVEIKPDDGEVLLFLIKLLSQIGSGKEALLYCDKLMAIPYHAKKALVIKAQLMAFQGQVINAIMLLNEELRMNPDRDDVWYILATIYAQHGETRLALEAAQKCKAILIKNSGASWDNIKNVNQLIERLRH